MITKDQLLKTIQSLPDGATLERNVVGNLAVFDKDGVYIGFVDTFVEGDFVSVEDCGGCN